MKRTLICFALLSIFVQAAFAGVDADGNFLLSKCKSIEVSGNLTKEQLMDFTYCLGYVSGYADSIRIQRAIGNFKTDFICLPDGVKYKQLVMVVVKYLKDNPEQLHEDMNVLTWRAFNYSFQCK